MSRKTYSDIKFQYTEDGTLRGYNQEGDYIEICGDRKIMEQIYEKINIRVLNYR